MDTLYKAREGLKFIVTTSGGQLKCISATEHVKLKNHPTVRRMVKDGDIIKVKGGE